MADKTVHHLLLDAVRNYQMPDAAEKLLEQTPPLIIAGVTASGKDSITNHMKDLADYEMVITHTTRPIRSGEQNGREYWFVNEEQMLQMINKQAFIDVKWIHNQQVSGPSIKVYSDVITGGKKPILIIEVQGIESLLDNGIDAHIVFILPPSFDEWMKRLEDRGHMSHTEKVHRLKSAELELDMALRNDRFQLIVNHSIQQVAKDIMSGAKDNKSQWEARELIKKLIDHIHSY